MKPTMILASISLGGFALASLSIAEWAQITGITVAFITLACGMYGGLRRWQAGQDQAIGLNSRNIIEIEKNMIQGTERMTNHSQALDQLLVEVTGVKTDVRELGDRTTRLESSVNLVHDRLGERSATLADIDKKLDRLLET